MSCWLLRPSLARGRAALAAPAAAPSLADPGFERYCCCHNSRVISVVMSDTDTCRLRRQAEECRQLAAKACDQTDKDGWLRLAAEWLKLAHEAEKRRMF